MLFEFPVKEIGIDLPQWLVNLPEEHPVRAETYKSVSDALENITYVRDISLMTESLSKCEYITDAGITGMDLGVGSAWIRVNMNGDLFYKILAESTGIEIDGEQTLLKRMKELAQMKKDYERIKAALNDVSEKGYGIVMPTIDELTLEEPEIVKQAGRYGVRLCASAPSIHMMKANIKTEVAPIVGSESQSEELVKYLLEGFEEDPTKIWDSNIFGKPLNELVNEGLRNKLYHIPDDAGKNPRTRYQRGL